MLFFSILYSSKNPENKIYHIFHKKKKDAVQLFSNMNNNVSWSANVHIRRISEGSCDTADWSNDAENAALKTDF